MNLFNFSHLGALLVFGYSVLVAMNLWRFRVSNRAKGKTNFFDKLASYAHLFVLVFFIILGAYSALKAFRTEPIKVYFTIDFTI